MSYNYMYVYTSIAWSLLKMYRIHYCLNNFKKFFWGVEESTTATANTGISGFVNGPQGTR